MEAKALYNFDATAEDELSFRQGECLKVRCLSEDQNWFQAEIGGRKGYIPSTYIQMEAHEWYKGKMSRSQAEQFLMQTTHNGKSMHPDGTFIVRDSESDRNQFSLSVKHGNSPQHFKILCNAEGQYYLWPNSLFPSINKLIDYHRTVSIARDSRVTILLRDLQDSKSKGPKMYVAKYNFHPDTPDELGFKKGDVIRFIKKEDENWWKGVLEETNEQGLFPCNYVEEM